jgi:hypothetical protein
MLVGKKTNSDGSVTFTFLSEEVNVRTGIQIEKPSRNPNPAPRQPTLDDKLLNAAHQLKSERVAEYLKRGANPNCSCNGYDSKSALRTALQPYKKPVDIIKRGCMFDTVKLLLDHGAVVNNKVDSKQTYSNLEIVIRSRLPTNILNLLLLSDNNCLKNLKTNTGLLGKILLYPNYHKFQLLLCHGMALDGSTAQNYFQQFFQNCWPRPIQFYRKNQHKRKIIATTLMWRKLMILYCFLKRNVNAIDLSYLRNTSIKDFVTFKRNEITVHYI